LFQNSKSGDDDDDDFDKEFMALLKIQGGFSTEEVGAVFTSRRLRIRQQHQIAASAKKWKRRQFRNFEFEFLS
jgi:hypothetical protein